jgi:hypothetical protein
MHGLDGGRHAEVERELNGRHVEELEENGKGD